MAANSQFQLDPETGLPDIPDFPVFGQALRWVSDDAETHRVSDGMAELSMVIERVAHALSSHARGASLGPLLVDLLTALRKHRQLVANLSEKWRIFYQHAAYLAALNNFRVLVGQWLAERNIIGDNEVVIEDFEMIGWLTLGEGLMMIDIYEQAMSQIRRASEEQVIEESRLVRAKGWWGKLRGNG